MVEKIIPYRVRSSHNLRLSIQFCVPVRNHNNPPFQESDQTRSQGYSLGSLSKDHNSSSSLHRDNQVSPCKGTTKNADLERVLCGEMWECCPL